MLKFSPRSEGSRPHVRLASTVKKSPFKVSLLRLAGLIFGQRAVGNRNSTLKGCTQNFTHSGTQGRSSNLKGTWVRLPADLGEPPGEGGGNWSSHWELRHWGQPLMGACSTTRTLVLESTILEYSLLARDTAPPTSRPAALRPPEPTTKES